MTQLIFCRNRWNLLLLDDSTPSSTSGWLHPSSHLLLLRLANDTGNLPQNTWTEKLMEAKMPAAAAAAKSLQSCLTLCDPIDGSPQGSPVPGILQARILEWVAISFSNAWKWKVNVKLLSRVRLLVTPWTAALQAPPSMGFSRQEYWSGVQLPSPVNWVKQL